MGPLQNNQKESIIKRIQFIKTELEDLSAFNTLSYQEYKINRNKRRNVERIEENILNAIIDIGKVLLSGENIEIPNTYREIFIQLHLHGVVKRKTGEELAGMVKLRNILAHQYLDLSWDYIKSFIKTGQKAVKTFIKEIDSCV